MSSNKVQLIDFWPDGYVGHTDSNGDDIGKSFLKNLFTFENSIDGLDIDVYSHFKKTTKMMNILTELNQRGQQIFRDPLSKMKKLHGYDLNKFQLRKESLNIWYTSENRRPPLDEHFDLYLSHDLDSYDGRNHYLPIWATRLGRNLHEAQANQTMLMKAHKHANVSRKGICAIISNPEPIRMAFIKEATRRFDIDIYGAFGLPLAHKDQILRKYKFNICFENDEYPGYVTEKPFEAWLGGCVPIWRGLDSGNYLNQEAIINVTQLGFSESLQKIGNLLSDNVAFDDIARLPILKKEYDYEALANLVRVLSTHKKT